MARGFQGFVRVRFVSPTLFEDVVVEWQLDATGWRITAG